MQQMSASPCSFLREPFSVFKSVTNTPKKADRLKYLPTLNKSFGRRTVGFQGYTVGINKTDFSSSKIYPLFSPSCEGSMQRFYFEAWPSFDTSKTKHSWVVGSVSGKWYPSASKSSSLFSCPQPAFGHKHIMWKRRSFLSSKFRVRSLSNLRGSCCCCHA